MGYFTIKDEASEQFEEKKSIFIGSCKRIYNEEEARDFIYKIKSQHKEAKHNVFAYIIGSNMGIQRYSDDGEPQGTGGLPVLEVIKKNGITDTVIVVTRYFGGILLGKGGLVRAYSKAAAMAVESGSIVEKVKALPISIRIDYDLLGKLQYFFEQKDKYIEEILYTEKVDMIIFEESKEADKLQEEIMDITNGKCEMSQGDEAFYFKLDNRLFKDNKDKS